MLSWLNYANLLHNERNNSLTYQVLNTLNGKSLQIFPIKQTSIYWIRVQNRAKNIDFML